MNFMLIIFKKSMDNANTEKEDFISINESICEIHFNAGINSKSISTLIDKLLL